MGRVIHNRKTARRIEMDSVIEEVKPPAFAQFICDKTQEFFPERSRTTVLLSHQLAILVTSLIFYLNQ